MDEFEFNRVQDAFHQSHAELTAAHEGLISGCDLELVPAPSLSRRDLLACFALLESSSSQAYQESSRGWNPASKKREMMQDSLYYLLLRSNCSEHHKTARVSTATIVGFLSFEFSLEERNPNEEERVQAAYCWEIHLSGTYRGHGAGRSLMHMMERIAQLCDRQRTMLCVFVSNKAAIGFYTRLGYCHFKPGEMPEPKKLRGRSVVPPVADSEYLVKDLSSHRPVSHWPQ